MKNKFLLVCTLFAALLFAGCNNGENGASSYSGNGENHRSDEPGMYVAITGFNKFCYIYGDNNHRYWRLTDNNEHLFASFINSLSYKDASGQTINGTALYYTVDNALTYLEKSSFDNKLNNVSIITFTDGLDQGSSALDEKDGNNGYAQNTNTYIDAISKKIKELRVNGNVSVDAYAIGLRGSDIPNNEEILKLFKDNLVKLSSKPENAHEVTEMSQINAEFHKIADSLYKDNTTITFKVRIPKPGDNNMPERFTLDLKDDASSPDNSKMYIEGKYDKVNGALIEVKYVGCMSSSGATIKQEAQDDGDVQFSFENFTDAKGDQIDLSAINVCQWNIYAGTSTWLKNTEFSKERQPEPDIQRSTAVAILLLDCSSSLGADISKVKSAANEFIHTLANGVGNNPSGGDNPGGSGDNPGGGGTSDNEYHCWELSYTIYGERMTDHVWATEEELKAMIATAESNISDISYKRASANDASSCYALDENGGSGGGSSSSDYAMVRFKKEKAYIVVTKMSLYWFESESDYGIAAEYDFGTAAGASPYYEVEPRYYAPYFYYKGDDEEDWYTCFDDEISISAGQKYTITCGDDGDYLVFDIINDGAINAPMRNQVVIQQRIPKAELHKRARLVK